MYAWASRVLYLYMATTEGVVISQGSTHLSTTNVVSEDVDRVEILGEISQGR